MSIIRIHVDEYHDSPWCHERPARIRIMFQSCGIHQTLTHVTVRHGGVFMGNETDGVDLSNKYL